MRVRSLLAVAALALAAAPGRAAAGPLPGFIRFQTGPAGRHGLAGVIGTWSRASSPGSGSSSGWTRRRPPSRTSRPAASAQWDGTGFFLSSGTSDPDALGGTRAFARELRALRLPHARWLGPGAHDHAFWAAQLAPAIEYAFPPAG